MLGNYDPNMVKMLQETCAVESDYGQTSDNIMQMEDATRKDIVVHYLRLEDGWFKDYMMNQPLRDVRYCITMAMIHYIRTGRTIPGTRLERAKLWKEKYNTYLGKGTVEDYMFKAQLHLGDERDDI